MKISRKQILIFLSAISLLFIPVAAITTGNNTGIPPSGNVQTSITFFVPTTSPTTPLPSIAIPQNVGIVPIWLAVGITLIIIALGGLLWRYLHPKYVAPEDDK